MKHEVPVSQIMSTDLITITLKNTLNDAQKLFKDHHIRHIPVLNDNELVGVLSYSDLLKISYAEVNDSEDAVDVIIFDMFTIEQVMTKTVLTVNKDASVRNVAEILSKQSFHSVPVTDDLNKLVGIVTTTDLLNYFIQNT